MGARHAQQVLQSNTWLAAAVSAEVALPGSTVEYYKLVYRYPQYVPITQAFTFEGSATVGYGNTYRAANGINPDTGAPIKINGLPFFEDFYAGGISDVRSFRDNTLGPYGLTPGCTSVTEATLPAAVRRQLEDGGFGGTDFPHAIRERRQRHAAVVVPRRRQRVQRAQPFPRQ